MELVLWTLVFGWIVMAKVLNKKFLIGSNLFFFFNESNKFKNPFFSLVRTGIYVRVIGSLRAFMGRRHILVFRIMKIEDFNEITFHFLECIYVHLFNTKGITPPNAITTQTTSFMGNVAPNSAYTNPSQMYSMPLHNTTNLNELVLNCIRSSNASEGCSIQYISHQLRRSEAEIRAAIDFLSSEGFCYSTIDESHFQCTS